MIKFFRKIRQNLLMENKTGKYFKYAIGEIVLVVIGILIALQINNWNNNRIEKQFETQILKEISKSIKNDLRRNKAIIKNRILPKKEAIEKLIKNLNSKEMEHDSILWSYFSTMKLGATFTYDKGPYESLKSAGLQKIKYDSLRSKIINLYDNVLPRGKELLNIDKNNRLIRKQTLLDKVYQYKDFKYDNGWGVRKEIDFVKLRTSEDLRKLLDLEEGNYFAYQDRIGFATEYLEETLEVISNYLEQKND
jgi:hypothetical protein